MSNRRHIEKELSDGEDASSSSGGESPPPEVVVVEDLVLKGSNDPDELDAPLIELTAADVVNLNGRGITYRTWKIRKFAYPERTLDIIPWKSTYDNTHRPKDPFHDFDTSFHYVADQPHPHRFPVGTMDQREVSEYQKNPNKWFKSDYLSYYTDWSQMFVSHYEDKRDYFVFYTASGEMTSMSRWFDESVQSFDDTDINVAKIVSSIWKRVHPPSYYYFRQKKIDASPDPVQHGYNTLPFRKMKLLFDDLPQSFSIMKKRVISIIAGNGVHFICYLVVNFGAHFKDGKATDKESSFIANLDSDGGGEEMNPFVQWLLAVIYELEVWVAKFLNTPLHASIESPSLATIGRKCKNQVQNENHRVCSIPISHDTQAPSQTDSCNCGIFSLLNNRAAYLADLNHHVNWSKVRDVDSLSALVVRPFWELPTKPTKWKKYKALLAERITKFRTNFCILMWEQSKGSLPFSPIETVTDQIDGQLGSDNQELVYPDKTSAGMFSTQLQHKELCSAKESQRTRLQRGLLRTKSAGMTYEERQMYFKEQRTQRDENVRLASQPEHDAKMKRKKADCQWKESSETIQAYYRKDGKLLKREKEEVGRLLEKKFPVIKTTGEMVGNPVGQISHLKYFPSKMRDFTAKEKQVRRKNGQPTTGYQMHLSAYYQGLTYKKGTQHMVDELNIIWVRDCFEEPFLTLVKNIGKEETQKDVELKHRKWIPVPIGDSYNREVSSDLVVDVRVHYQQGDVKTCLFRSLASAFHHLGQKQTGNVLASFAKKYCNLPAGEQLKAAIKMVKNHEKVYKKVDYWKKEAVIARQDCLGQPNDNPKLFVLRGVDGGVHHAISVVGQFIFDSNLRQCLTLSKASLDWCCNCDGGFSKLHTVIQFRK